jgi:hypothetical protein
MVNQTAPARSSCAAHTPGFAATCCRSKGGLCIAGAQLPSVDSGADGPELREMDLSSRNVIVRAAKLLSCVLLAGCTVIHRPPPMFAAAEQMPKETFEVRAGGGLQSRRGRALAITGGTLHVVGDPNPFQFIAKLTRSDATIAEAHCDGPMGEGRAFSPLTCAIRDARGVHQLVVHASCADADLVGGGSEASVASIQCGSVEALGMRSACTSAVMSTGPTTLGAIDRYQKLVLYGEPGDAEQLALFVVTSIKDSAAREYCPN